MRRRAVLGLAATVGLLTAAPAAAQTPPGGTLALTELNKGSTFNFVDNAPKQKFRRGEPTRLSGGDMIVFTNPVRTADGRRGKLHATCIVTVPGKFSKVVLTCSAVFVLPDGQIWVGANTKVSGNSTQGAVTGGTGVYAGARGTFASRNTKSGSDDTFTFIP